jgi:GT2 family glycosyltransferase
VATAASSPRIGYVVIGRNEGERLKACLRAIQPGSDVVYVDSGSTDGSPAFAESLGFSTVQLDTTCGFTAARARNAGLEALRGSGVDYVQMIDGDCELDPGWVDAALNAFAAEPDLAIVFGRRRERFPDHSVYNRLCDDEWDVPVGYARACGGDALFLAGPLIEAGGYNSDIIAGEEPDLSLRLRQKGWRIRRIDHEMTRHDAAMTRFGQWWTRTKRSGHAFAELLHRHGGRAEPRWRSQVRSIVVWGGAIPIAILVLIVAGIAVPALLLAALALAPLYPIQVARLAARKLASGATLRFAVASAFFLTLGKLPQLAGAIRFHSNRLANRRSRIIEYKDVGRG